VKNGRLDGDRARVRGLLFRPSIAVQPSVLARWPTWGERGIHSPFAGLGPLRLVHLQPRTARRTSARRGQAFVQRVHQTFVLNVEPRFAWLQLSTLVPGRDRSLREVRRDRVKDRRGVVNHHRTTLANRSDSTSNVRVSNRGASISSQRIAQFHHTIRRATRLADATVAAVRDRRRVSRRAESSKPVLPTLSGAGCERLVMRHIVQARPWPLARRHRGGESGRSAPAAPHAFPLAAVERTVQRTDRLMVSASFQPLDVARVGSRGLPARATASSVASPAGELRNVLPVTPPSVGSPAATRPFSVPSSGATLTYATPRSTTNPPTPVEERKEVRASTSGPPVRVETQAPSPVIDIRRLTDEVYRKLEERLRIEKERRGL
jgi:hypothetical protein